jgi:hypothetical protein
MSQLRVRYNSGLESAQAAMVCVTFRCRSAGLLRYCNRNRVEWEAVCILKHPNLEDGVIRFCFDRGGGRSTITAEFYIESVEEM